MKPTSKMVLAGALSLLLAACSDTGPEIIGLTNGLAEQQGTEQGTGEDAEQVTDEVQGQAVSNDGQPDIVQTALAAGNFNTLAAALEATGLLPVLSDPERTFTVFAPTDDAFAALGQDTIDALLADPDTLRDILLYHVLADTSVDAATAISLDGQTTETANGDDIALSVQDGNLFINMSQVTQADIQTSNGIIHVIDRVLMPPADVDADSLVSIVDTAVNAGSFTTLVAALQATGLDAVLADENQTFTVFAPTDEAFAKLGDDTIAALLADPDQLTSILLYHVIAGQAVDSTTAISLAGSDVGTANGATVAVSIDDGNLFINESLVTAVDVAATNGVIHVIDTVLIPPTDTAPEADEPVQDEPVQDEPVQDAPEQVPPGTDAQAGTLLDIARSAGNFTILVAALEATGLDGAIGHPDDIYTIFAPTDDAFLALGQDTIDALLADTETLENILRYHVIAGTVFDAAQALSLVGIPVEASNGQTLNLNLRDSSLFVNDSEVIATDIRGVNGIIHVIDSVLIPPES